MFESKLTICFVIVTNTCPIGIVADFLSRYLGQYIDGFDPKQLKIGIWKGTLKNNKFFCNLSLVIYTLLLGQIEYQNIKLRADVLNSFSLPISIKDGTF